MTQVNELSHCLPSIGSSAREKLETIVVDRADELLESAEDITVALTALHREAIEAKWSYVGATELCNHVRQVWVGRILR